MHAIRCQCGTVRAQINCKGIHNHIVCYCRDCRAFAHFLGTGEGILDAQGGTEIIQVSQARLQFSQGVEQLAAIRLTDKGMVRWYTTCCKTPLGNIMSDPKMAFIGLIHAALDRDNIDKDFGPITARFETAAALGVAKPAQHGIFPVICRFIGMSLAARLSGSYKQSPLFDVKAQLIVQARVLDAATVAALKAE